MELTVIGFYRQYRQFNSDRPESEKQNQYCFLLFDLQNFKAPHYLQMCQKNVQNCTFSVTGVLPLRTLYIKCMFLGT